MKEIEYIELKESPGYFAGSDGIIYSSHKTGKYSRYNGSLRPLKGGVTSSGYLAITLKTQDGSYIHKDIHPLICRAYHGDKPSINHEVAHEDGNKYNNTSSNLSWKTHQENQADRLSHGTDDRGYRNSRAKLTEAQCSELKWLLEETDLSRAEIGAKFGLSTKSVHRIVRGDRYPGLNIKPKWNSVNRRKRGNYK